MNERKRRVLDTRAYRTAVAPRPPVEVRVWGDLACFTRPEQKAERVSYPVLPPSAAVGILSAIFTEPEFEWVVREIWVLREIAWMAFMRNEVSSKAVVPTIQGWGPGDGFFADDPAERTQRLTVALRDVAYLIRADVALSPDNHERSSNDAKYRAQFSRRVNEGRCTRPPSLGLREFTAHFGPRRGQDRPIRRTMDLGQVLLDVDHVGAEDGSVRRFPIFFPGRLESGVLRVPNRRAVS